jgi:MFS family permease
MRTDFDAGPDDSDAPGAPSALLLLFIVYLFNYLDRTLIYILFQPIKTELRLTDVQLALLGSTSFVLFYTTLGVPFGRLADRVRRTRMIAVGLFVWSAASALTGAMHDFLGLFLCRVLVGVGEATLGPAALSLLSDLFSPRRRATVNAAFSAAIPIGAGAALLGGGALAAYLGWRNAFLCCGLPGVVLALVVFFQREPVRGRNDATPAQASESLASTLRTLVAAPGLLRAIVGYALFAVAANALSMWVPTLLVRAYGLTLAKAGVYTGAIAASCGLLGVLGGGACADALQARVRDGRAWFVAAAALACAALWTALLGARSVAGVLVPYGGLTALGLSWLGPAAAEVQSLAGPSRRGTAIGVYFFVVNALGYGIAPLLIGRVSDAHADASQLRLALLVCPLAALLAAGVLAPRVRRLAAALRTA